MLVGQPTVAEGHERARCVLIGLSAVEDISFYPFNVIIKPDGTIAYISKTTQIDEMLRVLTAIAKEESTTR